MNFSFVFGGWSRPEGWGLTAAQVQPLSYNISCLPAMKLVQNPAAQAQPR